MAFIHSHRLAIGSAGLLASAYSDVTCPVTNDRNCKASANGGEQHRTDQLTRRSTPRPPFWLRTTSSSEPTRAGRSVAHSGLQPWQRREEGALLAPLGIEDAVEVDEETATHNATPPFRFWGTFWNGLAHDRLLGCRSGENPALNAATIERGVRTKTELSGGSATGAP